MKSTVTVNLVFLGTKKHFMSAVIKNERSHLESFLKAGDGICRSSCTTNINQMDFLQYILTVTNFKGSPSWTLANLTYSATWAEQDPTRPRTPYTAASVSFDRGLSPEAASILGHEVINERALIQLRAYGGAMALSTHLSAWPHRNEVLSVHLCAFGAEQQPYIDQLGAALAPHSSGLRYFNYADTTSWASPNASSVYFGSNVHRLKAIKAAYDPLNRIGGVL